MLDGRGFGGKFFAEDCDCAAQSVRPTFSSHWSRNLDAEVPDPRRIRGQNLAGWTGGIDYADFAGMRGCEIGAIDAPWGPSGSRVQNGT